MTNLKYIDRRKTVKLIGAATLGSGILGFKAQAQTVTTLGGFLSQSQPLQANNTLMQIVESWRFSNQPFERVASELYRANDTRSFWHSGTEWTPAALGVFQALFEAPDVGLNREDYLDDFQGWPSSSSSGLEIAVLDALLTAGSMRYYFDADLGTQNNANPYQAQAFFVDLLNLDEQSAYAKMIARNPQNRLFAKLSEALAAGFLPTGQRRQILVNMHRLRTEEYEPHNGKQLIVDLGLQQLHAYDNNRLVKAMDVVVGKPDRRTPILRDQIVSLKFSPDWTVPQTIAREDLVPIMMEDPSIVEELGLSVRNALGQDMDLTQIDWGKYVGRNFPYTFYQRPGMKNLLGGVRFSLTNDQAIYLHDSPDIEAFDSGTRAFSSGCVRVGDATGLAHWIMSDEQGWTEGQVVSAMISGRTNFERLQDPVKVLFTYSTATLNWRGELVLMPDIYGEDLALAIQIGV